MGSPANFIAKEWRRCFAPGAKVEEAKTNQAVQSFLLLGLKLNQVELLGQRMRSTRILNLKPNWQIWIKYRPEYDSWQFQVTVFSRFCYVLLCNHEYIHCLNHRQAKDYITRRNKTERKLLFERRQCISVKTKITNFILYFVEICLNMKLKSILH